MTGLSVSSLTELLATGEWAVPAKCLVPLGAPWPIDVRAARITHDSRRVTPGTLFCCVAGRTEDGHRHAAAAVSAGAPALLVEHEVRTDPAVPQILVPEVRAAMGPAAAEVYGQPARAMEVVGVTGTNGKTTTTMLLASIFRAAGKAAEVIGTLTHPRTTPEGTDLQELLAEQRARGVAAVAMEVSSHALALHRVDGMRFRAGVFTNLTQDHLDFHETMEAYFRAKASLFEPRRVEVAVVNGDDTYGRLLVDAARVPTVAFHMSDAEALVLGVDSTQFRWNGVSVELPLGGAFNVANALAAATTALELEIPLTAIAEGLSTVAPVPGRFEAIRAGQPFTVIVDYAHTPDGLRRVLASARATLPAGARLLVVFGCGGDRDKAKRPLMGEAASEAADMAILTSDNPRSEDPMAIIRDARAGVRRVDVLTVEPDRRAAIAIVLRSAKPGDVVIVAGKGHEVGQEIKGVVHPFDDRLVVAELVAELGLA